MHRAAAYYSSLLSRAGSRRWRAITPSSSLSSSPVRTLVPMIGRNVSSNSTPSSHYSLSTQSPSFPLLALLGSATAAAVAKLNNVVECEKNTQMEEESLSPEQEWDDFMIRAIKPGEDEDDEDEDEEEEDDDDDAEEETVQGDEDEQDEVEAATEEEEEAKAVATVTEPTSESPSAPEAVDDRTARENDWDDFMIRAIKPGEDDDDDEDDDEEEEEDEEDVLDGEGEVEEEEAKEQAVVSVAVDKNEDVEVEKVEEGVTGANEKEDEEDKAEDQEETLVVEQKEGVVDDAKKEGQEDSSEDGPAMEEKKEKEEEKGGAPREISTSPVSDLQDEIFHEHESGSSNSAEVVSSALRLKRKSSARLKRITNNHLLKRRRSKQGRPPWSDGAYAQPEKADE